MLIERGPLQGVNTTLHTHKFLCSLFSKQAIHHMQLNQKTTIPTRAALLLSIVLELQTQLLDGHFKTTVLFPKMVTLVSWKFILFLFRSLGTYKFWFEEIWYMYSLFLKRSPCCHRYTTHPKQRIASLCVCDRPMGNGQYLSYHRHEKTSYV